MDADRGGNSYRQGAPRLRGFVLAGLAMFAPVRADAQLTLGDEIVSRSSGGQLGGGYGSAISGDGRFVAFASAAAFVTGDTNGQIDIYVFDRVAATMRRVSTTTGGAQADGSSERPSISPDGRFVAFETTAPNLLGNAAPRGVVLKDLQADTLTRIDVNASVQTECARPDVSDDGNRVVYVCATNGAVFSQQILVKTRSSGAIAIVDGTFDVLSPLQARISGDGGSVAFMTFSDYPVQEDGNGVGDVYRYRLSDSSYRLVSAATTGGTAQGSSEDPPGIDRTGCRIAFASTSNTLVSGDTNLNQDAFVRDLCANTIERVSVDSDGFELQGVSSRPVLSADARYVAFETNDPFFRSPDNQVLGKYLAVRDRQGAGSTDVRTFLVGGQTFDFFAVDPAISDDGRQLAAQASGNTPGDQILAVGNSLVFAQPVAPVNNPNGGEMFAPVPSSDGNLVLVSSDAAGFDQGWSGNDADGTEDAFVFRADTGAGACMEQASMSSGDFNSPCFNPALKHEKGPTPNTPNIPCPDPNATEICAPSIEPTMAASRMLVAFVTADAAVATVKNESKTVRDARRKASTFGIYLRDLVNGSLFRVGTALPGGTGTAPQLSVDGNSIVFVTEQDMSIEDINTGADAYQIPIKPNLIDGFGPPRCLSCKDTSGSGNNPPGAGNPVVSANGNVVAMNVPTTSGGTQILLRNLVTGSSQRIGTASGSSQRPRMDFSGSRLVFGSDANLDGSDGNAKPDVYLFESCCNKVTRVSKPISGDASDASADAIISGDGRTVSYVSLANNLDPTDPASNGKQHVFVQRLDGVRARLRLARNTQGQLSDNDSFRPALGYNGNALFFDSLASNLKDGEDFNPGRDVFRRLNPVSAEIVFGAGFE